MYIYIITNINNGKFYIGSTLNIEKRFKEHFNRLQNKNHINKYLQNSFNKHGIESFKFEYYKSKHDDRIEEQQLLDKHYDSGNLYNISKNACGGDNISYHPDRDLIVFKISNKVRERYSKMSKDDIMKIHSKPLNSNYNWKGGISINHCSCGKKIAQGALKCRECMIHYERSGDKNPFYGKKHSDESKKKISESQLGIPNKNCRKKISINGVVYDSCSIAAKSLGVSAGTITHRSKSKNEKYKDYIYLT